MPDFSLHLLLCRQIEASHWVSIRGNEKTAQLGSSINVTSEITCIKTFLNNYRTDLVHN